MMRRSPLSLLPLVLFALSVAGVRSQVPPPARIVSLVPAVTEMLFAMGAGSLVVGVSSHDAFPPEAAALPRVGALVDPDFERVLSLRPTLVIVYGSQDELIRRLGRAGIEPYRYRHGGLADITSTIRELGRLVGREGAAAGLAAGIETDIDNIRGSVAGRRKPATALIFGRENGTLRGIHASAGVGFLHDMLLAAGGNDVFGDVPRESLQVSVEVLLARQPDVIVEIHPSAGWTPERVVREKAVWSRLSALPAVRDGRVHILADDRLVVPGPRVAEALRLIAGAIHPRAQSGAGRPLPIVLVRVPAVARRIAREPSGHRAASRSPPPLFR
jgi:iron complex transport system substrate-binding protein